MDTVKILLTSDLHLGMERVNPLISRDERLNTLKKIGDLAAEHQILLLAGDILNASYIDRGHIDAINDELLRVSDSGTEIFLTPGNGEMEQGGSVYNALSDLKTTFTFENSNKDTMVKSGKGEIYIYGSGNIDSQIPADLTRCEKNGFHIGLFHADFSPQSTDKGAANCIGKKEIKQMNLDFFALGKNHGFRLFRFSERLLGAYPGSPEPCSLDECGERFVISIDIENNRIASFRRIPINTISVNSREIDCSAVNSESDLISTIKNSGDMNALNRIELLGTRDFSTGPALREELSGCFRGLKVIDRTELTQRAFIEEASAEPGFRGMFFRNLQIKGKSNPLMMPDVEIMDELFTCRENDAGRILFCGS